MFPQRERPGVDTVPCPRVRETQKKITGRVGGAC